MYPDLNNQKNKINNKENSFLKNSSIYLISTIVTALTAFITLPIYTRYLSPSDFGILALFGIFGMVTSRLLSFGITAATYRYYFDYKDDLFNFKVLNSTNLIFILFLVNSTVASPRWMPWYSKRFLAQQEFILLC